jgi:HEAT repeat protein
LPYLVAWIRYEPPHWKIRFFQARQGLLELGKREPWWERDKQMALALQAIAAFEVIGPEARAAIPQLSTLLDDPKRKGGGGHYGPGRAAAVLGHLGKDGLPVLVRALTNSQGPARFFAVEGIGMLGTNARPALPILIRSLADMDEAVAWSAAQALGSLKLEADTVVSALMVSIQDSRPMVRRMAAYALANFADQARTAVPLLVHALNDADPYVQQAATNSLCKIDPAALERGTR